MRIALTMLLFVLLIQGEVALAGPGNSKTPDKDSIRYLRSLNAALWDELNLNALQREGGEDTRLDPENDFPKTLKKINKRNIRAILPEFTQASEFWDDLQKDTQLLAVAPLGLIIHEIISHSSYFMNDRLENFNEITKEQLSNALVTCHCYTYAKKNNTITSSSKMVTIPTPWLHYAEIVSVLLSGHITTKDVAFLRQPKNYDEQGQLSPVGFHSITFDGFPFTDSLIERISFEDCDFKNTDFRDTKLYCCRFIECHFKNIAINKETRIETSDISDCIEEERDRLIKLVGKPQEQEDSVLQLLTLLFLLQKPGALSERYEYADDLVSADYIQKFIGNYQELAKKHPRWISVATQVLYAAARYKNERMEGLVTLSKLMQEYSGENLNRLRHLETTDDYYWLNVLNSIDWHDSELTDNSLLYQSNLRHFLASNNIEARDVPHDNFCLYHVLYDNELGSSIEDIRTRIQVFMNTYLMSRNEVTASGGRGLLRQRDVDEYSERFINMDHLLDPDSNSPITYQMAEQFLDSVNNFGEWLDISSLPLLAIIFERPLLQIVPGGSTVDVGYIHPNGQAESDWREAIQESSQPPVVIIHNGANHWLTATFLLALTHLTNDKGCAEQQMSGF